MPHIELERLVMAGAVDRRFRASLLAVPLQAVSEPYYTDFFDLTAEEREVVACAQKTNFQVFAEAIAEWISCRRVLSTD